MSKKIVNCPRCFGENIKNYEKIIECLDCNLEFDKKDIISIEDKLSILSIQEKKKIIKTLSDFKK